VLPGFACFACFDTGIVSNQDMAINTYLPDYDVLPSGERMSGSDPAVICCCMAAYAGTGRGGGFRDSSGPLRIETAAGPRFTGIELPQEATAEIHRARRQQAYAVVPATAEQARVHQALRADIAGLVGGLVDGLLPSMGKEET
jgi:hypothetical protein